MGRGGRAVVLLSDESPISDKWAAAAKRGPASAWRGGMTAVLLSDELRTSDEWTAAALRAGRGRSQVGERAAMGTSPVVACGFAGMGRGGAVAQLSDK